jgi:predicted deacetylase
MTNQRTALCVSIHDVAPATWSDCLCLLDAVRAVADIPLTWLVVPRFHGNSCKPGACDAMLGDLQARGHELALHGYTHLDPAPTGLSLREFFLRHVYTQREGEFSAIGAAEARCRIELGLDWFAQRGWRPSGFVAPAWLLGSDAWRALADYPFAYTTTYRRFYLLPSARAISAPALVYAARNRVGRLVSPPVMGLLARCLEQGPLLRLALHPRDAHHPAILRHMQALLEQLLHTHAPMTKAAFAAQLASQSVGALRTPTADDATSPA